MLTVVRRLCGQPATGPSEVFDQSIARIKLPISPPPAKKASGSESENKWSRRRFMIGAGVGVVPWGVPIENCLGNVRCNLRLQPYTSLLFLAAFSLNAFFCNDLWRALNPNDFRLVPKERGLSFSQSNNISALFSAPTKKSSCSARIEASQRGSGAAEEPLSNASHERAIATRGVIDELIKLAKEIRDQRRRYSG